MNFEKGTRNNHLNRRRLAPIAGLMTVALGIAGCGGGSSASNKNAVGNSKVAVTAPTTGKSKETAPSSGSTSTTSTPNVSSGHPGVLMKPNLQDFCADGAVYPCQMPLTEGYKAGTQKILIIENENNADLLTWPVGTAGGNKGNAVSVECYVTDGERITGMYGPKLSSTDWYEIAVPLSRVTDPTVLSEVEHPGSTQTPPIKSFSYQGVQYINGWSAIVDFNQTSPSPNIPACK